MNRLEYDLQEAMCRGAVAMTDHESNWAAASRQPTWMLTAARAIATATDLEDVRDVAAIIAEHCPSVVGVTDRDPDAPHLEVRMQYLPIATVTLPWVQLTFDRRVWTHTGIPHERPTTFDTRPPATYRYGLLHGYVAGRPVLLHEFERQLGLIGVHRRSIEDLF